MHMQRRRPRRRGSSRSSATPSSTRATCGRRSPIRRCRASATSCSSSTPTARASTASIPDQKIKKVMEVFDGAGWHVVEAKYGSLLTAAFRAARRRRTCASTSTPCRTRSTSRCSPTPATTCASASCATPTTPCAGSSTTSPPTSWHRSCRTSAATTSACCSTRTGRATPTTDRPSVVFAYTVKGWGLPIAGDPLNHAALLTGAQIDELRAVARAHRRDRVGPLRSGVAGRAACAAPPAAS